MEYQYNDAGNVIGHIYYDARGQQVEYPPRERQARHLPMHRRNRLNKADEQEPAAQIRNAFPCPS